MPARLQWNSIFQSRIGAQQWAYARLSDPNALQETFYCTVTRIRRIRWLRQVQALSMFAEEFNLVLSTFVLAQLARLDGP